MMAIRAGVLLEGLLSAVLHGGPGQLLLYGGMQPGPGEDASANPLYAVFYLDPAGGVVTGKVLNFVFLSNTSTALSSGTVAWARMVGASGLWAVDGDAGEEGSGAMVELDKLTVSVGGYVTLESAAISEP